MKTRYKFVDNIKGFGILMIICAHCIQYFPVMAKVNDYVCSFHVPIFLITSGLLEYYSNSIKSTNTKILLQKKVWQLLVPWFIFSVFNALVKIGVLFILHKLTLGAIHRELLEFITIGNGTVWFLATLFCIEILYKLEALLGIIDSKILYFIITALSLLIPYFMQDLNAYLVGVIVLRTIEGLGYFMISRYIGNLLQFFSGFNLFIICIINLMVGAIVQLLTGAHIVMFLGEFEMFPYSLICAILTCAGFIMLFKCLELKKCDNFILNFMSFFGKNSLIVMLLHPTLLSCFTLPLSAKFSELDGGGVIVSLLLFMTIVIMDIPLIPFMNRFFPWTIGKNFPMSMDWNNK